jgi:hypothetical protein
MHPLNPEDLQALEQALPHMRTPKLIDEVISCLLTGKMLPEYAFVISEVRSLSPENTWEYVEFWAHRLMSPMLDGSATSEDQRKRYISNLRYIIDDYIPKYT